MLKKMYALSCAIGLFLIFIAFFAGVSLNVITRMYENKGDLNTQSILLLIGCLMIVPYIIKSLKKSKRIDIRVSGVVVIFILIMQCLISLYFIITHAGIDATKDYTEIILVSNKTFYIVCTTLRNVLTLLLMPCLGIFALFNAPEDKKTRTGKYIQISSSVFFFASALFLLMMTITWFKGVQQTLIVIARVANGNENIVTYIEELRLYNITSISLQQISHISDLKVGLTARGNISDFACSFGIVILVSYIFIVGVAINWIVSILADELTK